MARTARADSEVLADALVEYNDTRNRDPARTILLEHIIRASGGVRCIGCFRLVVPPQRACAACCLDEDSFV